MPDEVPLIPPRQPDWEDLVHLDVFSSSSLSSSTYRRRCDYFLRSILCPSWYQYRVSHLVLDTTAERLHDWTKSRLVVVVCLDRVGRKWFESLTVRKSIQWIPSATIERANERLLAIVVSV